MSRGTVTNGVAEEGAAAVVVRLRHGGVVVTREDDGATLLASPALEGDWDRLWAVLESFGGGPVARTARTTGEDGARRPYVR